MIYGEYVGEHIVNLEPMGVTAGDTRPLYPAIADHIERQIVTGKLRHRDRLPTTSELAGFFNVTLVTVQQGLVRLADKGLLTRIPRAGTFVNASPLRQSVGIVLGDEVMNYQSAFPRLMLTALLRSFDEASIETHVYAGLGGAGIDARLRGLRRDVDEGKIGSIIGLSISPEFSHWLLHQDALRSFSPAGYDLKRSIKLGVAHLLQRGARDIKLVSMTGDPVEGAETVSLEKEGFLEACEEAGVAPSRSFHLLWGPKSIDGYEGVKGMFKGRGRKPDALFINHDVVTRGALQGLSAFGIRIPDDLALVTHFNKGDDDFLGEVPLTRVEVDPKPLAAATVRFVRESLPVKGKSGTTVPPTVPEAVKLKVGKSCGE